jgi:hypothetical protein
MYPLSTEEAMWSTGVTEQAKGTRTVEGGTVQDEGGTPTVRDGGGTQTVEGETVQDEGGIQTLEGETGGGTPMVEEGTLNQDPVLLQSRKLHCHLLKQHERDEERPQCCRSVFGNEAEREWYVWLTTNADSRFPNKRVVAEFESEFYFSAQHIILKNTIAVSEHTR